MSFHQKLKEARIAAGFTQSQMAARMGLDKTSYSGYETGRRQPNLQRLRQMSQLLQVSADSLLEISSQDQATPQELSALRKYRMLDLHGQELVGLVLDKEYERMAVPPQREERGWVTYINCYDLAVSAGTGEPWVDAAYKTRLEMPQDLVPDRAHFCVRVNGQSMEPAYRDGDIVFVERCETVNLGEIGIFFLNGDGFIKRLGRARLESLNPDYGPIRLSEFDDLRCQGRVLGKVPAKAEYSKHT
ncbi:MAG: LexA family transcriptional regulator [Acutalibacter sp.]|jgi:repressor LexA|nr:LexA family transcriptional regulator [Acutalibacter sp.]